MSQIRAYYEHLHAHPELSFRETETAKYIEKQLRKMGLEVHRMKQNAVMAYLKGNGTGKTIGVRADIDALPLQENTKVRFQSKKPGVMHACGHDLHSAAALGAALTLSANKSELPNNVLFIFQHAEEKIPGGAQDVIQSDFFREHWPDIMLAQHVFPDLKAGEAGFHPGAYMASGDEIDIHITGPGGHAAMPHKTVDTITTAAHVLVALQQVKSRFIPSEIPSVLSFGNIISNSVMNIIPKEVVLEGTFRIMNEEWRAKALKKIEKIAQKTAATMGAGCNVVVRNGYPSIQNNEEHTATVRQIAEKLLGKEKVHHIPVRMTTDDFGYYAREIPSVYFRIGVANENNQCAGLHTADFLPADGSLETATKLMTETLLKFV